MARKPPEIHDEDDDKLKVKCKEQWYKEQKHWGTCDRDPSTCG